MLPTVAKISLDAIGRKQSCVNKLSGNCDSDNKCLVSDPPLGIQIAKALLCRHAEQWGRGAGLSPLLFLYICWGSVWIFSDQLCYQSPREFISGNHGNRDSSRDRPFSSMTFRYDFLHCSRATWTVRTPNSPDARLFDFGPNDSQRYFLLFLANFHCGFNSSRPVSISAASHSWPVFIVEAIVSWMTFMMSLLDYPISYVSSVLVCIKRTATL